MPLTSISNSTNMRNSTNKQNTYQVCFQGQQNKSPRKFTNMSPSRKLNNISPTDQLNLINQLKIKLADKQFQLKKLEEDQSVKYTQVVKELQKEKLQKKQLIKQWKQKFDEEVEYWNRKIQLLTKENQLKLKEKGQKESQSVQIKMNLQKKILEEKFQSELKKLEETLEKTKSEYQKEIQDIKLQNNQQIQKLSLQHKQALQNLKKQLNLQIQSLKTAHTKQILFYNQLQQKKSKQTKAIQRIFHNKIKNLQQQLVYKIGQIRQLNLLIDSQNKQIQQLKRQKQNYRLDNICLQRKYKKLSSDLQGQFDGKFDEIKQQYEKMYKVENDKFIQQLQMMNKSYHQCKQKYEAEIKLKDQRAENLLMIFNTSKSKQEDLKKIEMLETKLSKKQLQLQKQREDLKICRLQLNNMDQLFQKMFQQAKLKSSKVKKLRLPSLMAKNLINRSTMDVYQENLRIQKEKEKEKEKNREKKFTIRDYSYQTMAKQVKDLKNELNVEL